jgi:hypothetical protein
MRQETKFILPVLMGYFVLKILCIPFFRNPWALASAFDAYDLLYKFIQQKMDKDHISKNMKPPHNT